MKNILLSISIFMLLISCTHKTESTSIAVVPQPNNIHQNTGSFVFNSKTKFIIPHKKWEAAADILISCFKKATGWKLEIQQKTADENCIVFTEDTSLPDEGYSLQITSSKISIKASSYNGFVYGVETLRQLLPKEIESSIKVTKAGWKVPNVTITDAPRFKWRGLMLDVSRHFFKKEYLLKTIDRLAFLKMNVLHLHLVDDQGWRIEIKKYPKLTEVGAWRVDQEDKHWNARSENDPNEKGTYGGFYTQEELKEVVAYAQKKGITIVPEIEMPAHVMSAIAAYPELSCEGTPIAVPSGGSLRPSSHIYCVGKEQTFTFLENVLTEVMEIFPSKYIHIGGDEATKTSWEVSKLCQELLKTEKLTNVDELQSYFIKRIEKFINSKGKRLIGWDEILEGGLAPQATVMSWRGVKGGLEASEQGHDVIMSPGTHCYFDHYQGNPETEPLAISGYTTLSKVYEFDPIVDTMTEAQKKHVLGGQANLWSEYITTESHSEYMLFPRLIALSETLWSKKEQRNWHDFTERIQPFFHRLDIMKINYAKSSKGITLSTKVDKKNHHISVAATSEFPNADIRYFINNGPEKAYTNPIQISKTTSVKAALFENGKMVGKPVKKTFKFHKAVGKTVSYTVQPSVKYKGSESTLVNIVKGSSRFTDGEWQGWNNQNTEITIDLHEPIAIEKVAVGCMENQGSWIFFPEKIEIWVSKDLKDFQKVGEHLHPYKLNGYSSLENFTASFSKQKARYIKAKVFYANHGLKGPDSWVFLDEIVVE